jgi:hypothetical protein
VLFEIKHRAGDCVREVAGVDVFKRPSFAPSEMEPLASQPARFQLSCAASDAIEQEAPGFTGRGFFRLHTSSSAMPRGGWLTLSDLRGPTLAIPCERCGRYV